MGAFSAGNIEHVKKDNQHNHTIPIMVLAFSAFGGGLITVLNDILVPHLKHAFNLTYFQASLVQFCFFGTYFVMSSASAWFMQRFGYKAAWIVSYIFVVVGCLLFIPAAQILSYPVFLFALFVLAIGVVAGGVVTTPLAALLAKSGREAQMMTITNTLNSLGTTIGPFIGAFFILSSDALSGLSAIEEAKSVQLPYSIVAGIGILIILCVFFTKVPDEKELIKAKSKECDDNHKSIWEFRHLVLGTIAMFCYVGAEVSIGTNLVSIMHETLGFNHEMGAKYIALYWGGAMVGRFIGIFLLARILPQKLLAFNTFINALLCCGAIFGGVIGNGWFTIIALLSIGLFNSICFPSIFALASKGLGKFTSQASGILFTAIAGGAIVPPIQGLVADHFSLLVSFIVPAVCYLYICFFGLKGHKIQHIQQKG